MPVCERCGGPRRGNGRGWCSDPACREMEKAAKKEAKRLRQERRAAKGAGARGPCPGEGAGGRPVDEDKARQEAERKAARAEKGAGPRGPCPAEGGRPVDEEKAGREAERKAARAEKGAGPRGPCPAEGGRPADEEKASREAERKEARAQKGAKARGPCPGEGGRPEDSEETILQRRGPPYANEEAFTEEEVAKNYQKYLRGWARFGLSRVCQECNTLTPARYLAVSKETGLLACKNCREGRTKYILPPLPLAPSTLTQLNAMERRLLAKAKVNQLLLDKLPSGGPSAQFGRMYVVPMDEPYLCMVLEGATFGNEGEIFVEGVQGLSVSTARLEFLHAALQTLKEQHAEYQNDAAVDRALEDMANILAHRTAATRPEEEQAEDMAGQLQGSQDEGGEGQEAEEMDVTYLVPRDPQIPKAEAKGLQKMRSKARHTLDNLDALLFPHLFPDGLGGYRQHEHQKFSEYARRRLLGLDGRFENDPAYLMWLLEEHMKKRLSGNVNVRMKGQLHPRGTSKYEDGHRQVFTALRDLPGTQPYLYAKKGVAMSMYEQLGRPHFFLTLTCHARQPNILAAVITARLLRDHGASMEIAELERQTALIMHRYQVEEGYTWQGMTANQLCNSMPAILSRQFEHGVAQLMHWLQGEPGDAQQHMEGGDEQDRPVQDEEEQAPQVDRAGRHHAFQKEKPPFKVKDYIIRIEWQKRGYPHAHILLWADVPDVAGKHRPEDAAADEVDWSDEDIRNAMFPTCAEDLSDKCICTKSSHRWQQDARLNPGDKEVNAKLATFVEHTCGPYCGRYTLGSCRFGFPREAHKQTVRRSPQEQFSSRWKGTLAARRHEDDGFIGQYNIQILRFWRASMDLQVICELTCASKYILGYAFKSEEDIAAKKRFDDIMQGCLKDAGQVDLTNQQIYKVGHAATQSRTTSTFEAAHLVLGYPTVSFSRGNEWVQVGPPSSWTLSVPQADEQEALLDPAAYKAKQEAEGLHFPLAQRWYQELQLNHADEETLVPVEGCDPVRRRWGEITFFDFVAGFIYRGKIMGRDMPKPRQKPAIVGHRNFSPDLQPEEFYYSKLILHQIWKEPGDWLEGGDAGSHAAAFRRVALDFERFPGFLQSTCFPKLDGTVQAARELQAVQSVMFLKAKMDSVQGWTHSRADEENYRDSICVLQALKDRHGEDIDFMAPDNVPTGPATDIFAPVDGGEAGSKPSDI